MAQTYAGSCLSLDQRTSATVHHFVVALWLSIGSHNLLVLCWSLDVQCLCCTDRTELIVIQTVESGHRAMQFYLEGLDAQQASPPWCRPFNFPTQCMPRLIHLSQFNSIHWLETASLLGASSFVCNQLKKVDAFSWRWLHKAIISKLSGQANIMRLGLEIARLHSNWTVEAGNVPTQSYFQLKQTFVLSFQPNSCTSKTSPVLANR